MPLFTDSQQTQMFIFSLRKKNNWLALSEAHSMYPIVYFNEIAVISGLCFSLELNFNKLDL